MTRFYSIHGSFTFQVKLSALTQCLGSECMVCCRPKVWCTLWTLISILASQTLNLLQMDKVIRLWWGLGNYTSMKISGIPESIHLRSRGWCVMILHRWWSLASVIDLRAEFASCTTSQMPLSSSPVVLLGSMHRTFHLFWENLTICHSHLEWYW